MSFAVFAEEVKHFLKDTGKDLIWLLRAAHHLPLGHALTGQEKLPPEEADAETLASWICYIRELQRFKGSEFQPLPTTGPEYFPIVYVVQAEVGTDECEKVLMPLEQLSFSRGGKMVVLRIPKEPWTRESEQDKSDKDRFAWGTLMPLYFKEVGQREKQWLVPFFQISWDKHSKGRARIGRYVEAALLQKQWHADDGMLFARHVALALLHPVSSCS